MKWEGKKDVRKMKLEPGTWHHAVVEVHGAEMVAQVDDQPPLYFEDDGLKVEKARLVLINYGQYAWFDDLKVWKAEASDGWPAKRTELKRQGSPQSPKGALCDSPGRQPWVPRPSRRPAPTGRTHRRLADV